MATWISLLHLLLLSITHGKKDKKDDYLVRAPVPVGHKPKSCTPTIALDEELFVTDDNCGVRRPFYVPGETLDIYTETVTGTTFITVTTSRILQLGTTTTLTKSLTVTTTTTQTSTTLSVSLAYATTTVNLSKRVFGGTV